MEGVCWLHKPTVAQLWYQLVSDSVVVGTSVQSVVVSRLLHQAS